MSGTEPTRERGLIQRIRNWWRSLPPEPCSCGATMDEGCDPWFHASEGPR